MHYINSKGVNTAYVQPARCRTSD